MTKAQMHAHLKRVSPQHPALVSAGVATGLPGLPFTLQYTPQNDHWKRRPVPPRQKSHGHGTVYHVKKIKLH